MFGRSPPHPLYNIVLQPRAGKNLGAAGEMVHHPGVLDTSRLNIIRGGGGGEEESHFEHFVIWCSLGPPQVVRHFVNVPLNLKGIKGFSF